MTYTKITKGNLTTYYLDTVKKYVYYKHSNGFESWREYENNNEIHYKDSDGYEWWSDDHPDNPKNTPLEVKEEDIKPFEFN